MGNVTGIEWTDATWNPVRGCSRVSPGCLNCYAEKIAARFSGEGSPFHLFAECTPQPHWTGKVGLVEEHLLDPLKWRKPRRVFVNSMSDLFHEDLPEGDIDRVFAVMALCPQHTFQVLTKRAERMREYITTKIRHAFVEAAGCAVTKRNGTLKAMQAEHPWLDAYTPWMLIWPLPNVWLGVSVEDQQRKARIDMLRETPASVRFLSLEPLLEDLGELDLRRIDWVIVGGESGPGTRPMHPDWARSIAAQCKDSGVPFFFKQWGGVNKKAAGRLLDGREWSEFPEVMQR